MTSEKILQLLELTVSTLQTDYEVKGEARKAITNLLRQVDEAHFELTGERIVKLEPEPKLLIHVLATGMYGH